MSDKRGEGLPYLDYPVLGEKFTIPNGAEITPIGIAHSPEFLKKNREILSSYVTSSDFLVLEADPLHVGDTMKHLDDPESYSYYISMYYFFGSLLDLAWKNDLPVLHADPYSITNVRMDAYVSIGYLSASCLSLGGGLLKDVINVLKKNPPMTRRQFLPVLGISIASLGLFASSTNIGEILTDYLLGGEAQYDFVIPRAPSVPSNPMSHVGYRNAAVMAGLVLAGKRDFVQGEGTMYAGSKHIREYELYSHNFTQAAKDYLGSAYRIVDKAIGTPPMVRLFVPDKTRVAEKGFRVTKAVPLEEITQYMRLMNHSEII